MAKILTQTEELCVYFLRKDLESLHFLHRYSLI